MTLKSINPFTNNVVAEFEEFSEAKIAEKLSAAEEAFKKWEKATFEYRKTLMLNVAELLDESSEKLSETISEEMGKPINEAKAEIKKCAWVCDHYAHNAEIMLHNEAVYTDGYRSFISYEPLGPILGIMPWNYPFWQVFRFVAPALMAGNVVLLKHASNTQLSAKAIESIFNKAGFPNGVFQNLPVGSGKVEKIIQNNAVKAVSLTGSEKAGREVAAISGSEVKKTVLELGGSNAFVVLADADLDKAAEIGLRARMQNGGQSCIAAKRFILDKKISAEFIDLFRKKMAKLKTGNPLDEETDIGPLSSVKQAEEVERQVNESIEAGAVMVAGGFPQGALYPPTILTQVKPGMPLFDEEVFGPVAPMIEADNEDDAIELANHTKFGLGVSLFTNDLRKAEEMIPRFSDGAVFINSMVKSDPRLPFGGTKKSGYGRELATHGIKEFVNTKTVFIDKFHEIKKQQKQKPVISTGKPS